MILIIGNSVDGVRDVREEITRTGREVVLFKADKCLDGEAVGFSFTKEGSFSFLDVNDKRIDLGDVESVWYWKPILPKELRSLKPLEDGIFIYRQFLALWRSLASLLADRPWVNDYYKALEAEHKPYQLKVASEIGFYVPDTLITSSPERMEEFWVYCDKQMIIKTLVLSPSDDRVVFTNRVTEDFMSKSSRLRSSPVILQRFIPKKQELRVTVVGEEIFAAEIKGEDEVDWRRGGIVGKEYTLPTHVKRKCIELVRALGLRYGCIDLIVTPDNQFVFLEINPSGQWSFIADETGMPIGKAIAKLLIQEGG